jgi:phenylacetate-CoA ligase
VLTAQDRFNSDAVLRKAIEDYGTPQTFMDRLSSLTPDQIRDVQLTRLSAELARAQKVPFYARRWAAAGFDPDDVNSLSDLRKIPAYTVDDIRESIDLEPPYGDYQGVRPGTEAGLRIFFSGGTTGRARPTVYTALDRILGSSMIARGLYLHGMRQGDVVLNAWAFSTHNAGWIFDQAAYEWIGATPITVGTGNVTSSSKQLELASTYGAKSIMASSDYLIHLRKVADELGMARSDFSFTFLETIGDGTRAAGEAWGVPSYDHYGFHEIHSLAAECPVGGGLHIWEDAYVVEIVDSETGEALPDGEIGDLVVTCFYKTGSPQVRYNTKDLLSIDPDPCPCGSPLRRFTGMSGRSDTMVKLRGINVWPEAIGDVAEKTLGRHLEYHCVAYRDNGQDQMIALIESQGTDNHADTAARVARALNEKLSVKITVALVADGALAPLTGFGDQAKLKRFTDSRGADTLPPPITSLLQSAELSSGPFSMTGDRS